MNLYQKTHGKFHCQHVRQCLFLLAMLVPLLGFGQQKNYTVQGTVKDKNGTLPGVSVLVEGTTTGTISDVSGAYALNFTSDQSSAKIAFSFIGYASQTQSISLSSSEAITLDVSMEEDVKQLDEVVVVGSTIRANKRELGNQISSVGSEALQRSGSSDIFSALQGKLPGA